MKRSHGPNSKQSRGMKSKGRRPITHQLKEWPIGTKILIDIDPHFHRGMPFPRFNGKNGEVIGRRGVRGYEVRVMDGDKAKTLLVTNVHLRKA